MAKARGRVSGLKKGAGGPVDGPKVTVGILTYERAWSLPEVLRALEALEFDKKAMRIVFVDRPSRDGTRGMIDEFASAHGADYESVAVVSSDSGISQARNECVARAAGTEFVFYLDSDVVPGPEALSRLVAHLRDRSVGVASLPYDSENSRGKLGPLVGAFLTPTGAAEAYKVAAGCTLISTEVFEKVGGFDERLNALEDGEFCYRARRAGYRVVCDFSYPARHLKTIKMGAKSYMGFARDSAKFYLKMVKNGSAIYLARYLLSAALLLAFFSLLLWPSVYTAAFLVGAGASSVAINASDRLWGDGSRIRLRYKPAVGLVFAVPTLLVTIYSAGLLLRRLAGVSSTS